SNIVRAIQRISTERGKDPRGFTLVPFGGAGPMQAVRVAEELGLARVVVPPHAGVLSALGLLSSDYVHYESRTQRLPVNAESMAPLRDLIASMRDSVEAFFEALGMHDIRFDVTFEMRYTTQAFEIPVEVDQTLAQAPNADAIRERFEAAHQLQFEFSGPPEQACEIVSVRLGGAAEPGVVPSLVPSHRASGEPNTADVYEHGEQLRVQCLIREALIDGTQGPLILEDTTSTIYVPKGWQAHHDDAFNLVITAV
ncbi:MAG: hydantoinase/oxoprolinase family protein, partial [Chromatiales bacterium]|nr:hydantoinase/oxoprolinase family protein [Chromatiales bacterium]